MNSTEIRSILRSPYNRENWKNLYRNIFQNKVTFFEFPHSYNINEEIVESLYQIGYATLDDEYIVALFEVNIKNDINLLSKKIGLRKVISKYISDDKFNGVLTIFENGSLDYRFTFASKTTKVTESGIVVSETESKRYTYILGGNEPCLTPSQRFEGLLKKNGSINLDDIKDAFSVDKLNKEFFNGYKEHYELFCNYLYVSNYKKIIFSDNEKLIRDFVKKFLGRIVFLYFVQKKGWLGVKIKQNWGTGDYQFLSNLFRNFGEKDKFYSKILSRIFFDFLSVDRKNDSVELYDGYNIRIPYLNGGLFEKDIVDESEINFLESDLLSLFTFFDRFNFTIYEDDPNEHTVAVDPEMLGHIFENLLEDNRDKGAFYTPKEIVHYMCQESLIEYLTSWFKNKGYEISGFSSIDKPEDLKLFSDNEGRIGQLLIESKNQNNLKIIDRLLIEHLLKKKLDDVDKDIIIEYTKEFNSALDSVKICDPAIGSGAFPMGLLQEIYTTKQLLWNFEYGNLNDFPSSSVKSNIIQNSIYGVDIEKGAVDIARLRFWLSLIVDEEEPKSLPNLDFKIVVGNSLVSLFENELIQIDWNIKFKNVESIKKLILDQQNKLYQLEHSQHLYFQSFSNKEILSKDIKRLKIDILKNQLNLTKIYFNEKNPVLGGFIPSDDEIKKNEINRNNLDKIDNIINNLEHIKNDDSELNYFDWRLNFPEIFNDKITKNVGFDILIGNPPYIQLQKDGGLLSKLFENLKFKTFEKTGDIYSLFYEKGIELLKFDGVLTFITSNKWMRAAYGKSTREFFCNHQPLKLIDLGSGVFDSATVDTNILTIKKSIERPSNQNLMALDVTNEKKISNFDNFEKSWIKMNDLNSDNWTIVSINEQQLNHKIDKIGKPLKELDVQINYGIKTGYNNAFIIDRQTKNELISKDFKNSEIIKPLLRGRDVKRYKAEFAEMWLINSHNGIKGKIERIDVEKDYPEIFKYFQNFELELKKRQDKGEHWTNLRHCTYLHQFEKEKIIYPNMTLYLPFIYDDKGFYTNQKCFIITSTKVNLKFLTGYFNSKISHHWIKRNCPELQGGTRELSKIFFENIPVPDLPSNSINEISTLVEEIIQCKENNIDSSEFENKIDNIIYDYFKLNTTEILEIENSLKK